mmetsp:Transcript_13905/g.33692  ORF Transcript_13905/g.33692 Transcript_13905/m.33692 type:complete len:240 (+) Transcript_13905:368-1087(+)
MAARDFSDSAMASSVRERDSLAGSPWSSRKFWRATSGWIFSGSLGCGACCDSCCSAGTCRGPSRWSMGWRCCCILPLPWSSWSGRDAGSPCNRANMALAASERASGPSPPDIPMPAPPLTPGILPPNNEARRAISELPPAPLPDSAARRAMSSSPSAPDSAARRAKSWLFIAICADACMAALRCCASSRNVLSLSASSRSAHSLCMASSSCRMASSDASMDACDCICGLYDAGDCIFLV